MRDSRTVAQVAQRNGAMRKTLAPRSRPDAVRRLASHLHTLLASKAAPTPVLPQRPFDARGLSLARFFFR
ncbi:MAG: hypothetical protein HYS27_17545 [Deltaproteobacteria bacterium]|nr:hypothetical protein [Deltaproteobacteria bacterium]